MAKVYPWDNLPEGLTLEMLDEYARVKENARRRADYAKHPDRVLRNRLTTATNLLNRHGRIVMSCPPPLPWTEAQQSAILTELAAAMEVCER